MKERFDLYFAGYYKGMEDIIFENNFNQLLSYVNEIKIIPKYIEAKKNGWKGKLLIDSGAFSIHKSGKEADIDAYIKFLNENHEYLDYYIELDDIPGKWGTPRTKEELLNSPIKTWENYLYMAERLEEPKKLLPVFHQGEDFKYLKQMLEYRDKNGEPIDYMCISSNKELDARKRLSWYKHCYEIIQSSSNPNIKIHSLGTQSQAHCQLIPFTSVDATSWIMTAANGNIYTKWGNITISEMQSNKKTNVVNDKAFVDDFVQYIQERGFTLEGLMTKSFDRIKFNCLYLGKWAREEREYKGPSSFKQRGRLF
ncbi:MAG: hypothetical protein ACI3T9_01085 [Romboutsia timonensis]